MERPVITCPTARYRVETRPNLGQISKPTKQSPFSVKVTLALRAALKTTWRSDTSRSDVPPSRHDAQSPPPLLRLTACLWV